MITEHFTFLSSDKETLIHAVKWLPDSRKYKAILQITHGMTEHILRYEEFAAFLTEHEYMVIGHDHLGHGTTAKRKEDFGYFTKSSPSDHLISDMHTLRITIRKENPNVPYFMMGHSMGSYLLRKYLSLHGESLEGSIIMGTGFVPPVAAVTGLFLIYAVALLKGWRYRSPFITGIMFGKSYKQFDQTGTDFSNSWLTRDAKIVEKNHSDPYTNFKFTLNGFDELERIRGMLKENVSNIVSITFDEVNAESLILSLQTEDVFCSMGSACSAPSEKMSETLKAIGLDDSSIKKTIRFSFGSDLDFDVIENLVRLIKKHIDAIKAEGSI